MVGSDFKARGHGIAEHKFGVDQVFAHPRLTMPTLEAGFRRKSNSSAQLADAIAVIQIGPHQKS